MPAAKSATPVEAPVVIETPDGSTAPQGGVILKDGEKLTDSAFEVANGILVAKDTVYGEFFFANTTRPAYKTLVHKGQQINAGQLERINEGRAFTSDVSTLRTPDEPVKVAPPASVPSHVNDLETK